MNVHAADAGAAIEALGLKHRYAGVLALDGVDLSVARGDFVAILGPNGAGKSTLAMILGGLLRPSGGRISIEGVDRTDSKRDRGFVDAGISLVPERRRLFGQLTVDENLILGAYGVGCDRVETRRRLNEVLGLMLPAIQNGRGRAAAMFSGGEQQMLAIGRALMADPRILILDEPSLGLAPIMTDRVYELLAKLHRSGVTVMVVEQIATHAVQFAKWIAVIERGTICYTGSVSDAATEEALRIGYLGHAK
jgi:branched-chain amino acid transport system ATP-binding protein